MVPEPDVEGSPHRAPWRLVVGIAVGIIAAGLIAAIVVTSGWGTAKHADLITKPNAAVSVLDGTYRVEEYPGQAVHRGHAPVPMQNRATITTWWAFRSTCISGICTAHGVHLDTADHTKPNQDRHTIDLVFKDGAWRDATPIVDTVKCGNDRAETRWTVRTFQPVLSGKSDASATVTVTDDGCGLLGNAGTMPMSLTRVDDAPAFAPKPSTVPAIPSPPSVPELPVQPVDPREEKLVADLTAHGVFPADFQDGELTEAAAARSVCSSLQELHSEGDQHIPTNVMVNALKNADLTRQLSPDQDRWLVLTSIDDLCPQEG